MIDTSRLLTDLRAERDRIEQAITAIEALNDKAVGNAATSQGGSPPGINQLATRRAAGGRRISAAGRKRISEAAKKMWAQRRTKVGSRPRQTMSPATKKKLSQAAKARWAERKKKAL
jgi:hypothetical protein